MMVSPLLIPALAAFPDAFCRMIKELGLLDDNQGLYGVTTVQPYHCALSSLKSKSGHVSAPVINATPNYKVFCTAPQTAQTAVG